MTIEQYCLKITSASPITIETISQVGGEIELKELSVTELKLYVERRDGLYQFPEIKATVEGV